MGTPLFINDAVRARALEVAEYARANRQNIHDMSRMMGQAEAGILNPLGHDPKRQLHIPMGYMLVYSIEQHPAGWMHHVSMSSAAKGRAPLPQSIDLAMEAMGLPVRMKDANAVWLEDLSGGEKAVNAVFPFRSEERRVGKECRL